MKKGLMLLTGFLVISLALITGGPVLAEEKVYINGFDADYPPFSFVGKDGKPAGISFMMGMSIIMAEATRTASGRSTIIAAGAWPWN